MPVVAILSLADNAHALIFSTGVPRPGLLALSILKAQEVTTNAVYRLSRAIYYCSWPVSDSLRATSPRVCTLVLFIKPALNCKLSVQLLPLTTHEFDSRMEVGPFSFPPDLHVSTISSVCSDVIL